MHENTRHIRSDETAWLSTARMAMTPTPLAFVTVSRQSGAGGTSFARALARHLNAGTGAKDKGWKIYDGNLTLRMLESNHLSSHVARFLPEDKVPEFNALIGELVGLHPSLWELVQKTNEAICELARQQHTIVVGRGANFATRHLGGGVHVRLVAPPEHRAARLAQLYNLTHQKALELNARRDAARRRYVKSTFGSDIEDPRGYDLVFNTAEVTLAEAVILTASLLRLRREGPPRTEQEADTLLHMVQNP
jgi:cytidylate kinase